MGTYSTILTLAYLELQGRSKSKLILECGLKTRHGNPLINPPLPSSVYPKLEWWKRNLIRGSSVCAWTFFKFYFVPMLLSAGGDILYRSALPTRKTFKGARCAKYVRLEEILRDLLLHFITDMATNTISLNWDVTLISSPFPFQPSWPRSSSWSSAAPWHNNHHVGPSLLSGTFRHSSEPETGKYVSKSSAVRVCYLPAPCALVVFQVWDISMAEPANAICIAIDVATGISTSLSYIPNLSGFPSFL